MSTTKRDLLARLVGSDTRARLLTHFHAEPKTTDTLDGLAQKLGISPGELEADLLELVKIGVIREQRVSVYSFDATRDAYLRKEISEELNESTRRQEQEPPEEVVRIPIGIGLIDDIVPAGIPSPMMLLLMGDPGSGKRELCLEFVARRLRSDQRVVYLTLEQSPEEIRASLSAMPDLGKLKGSLSRPERLPDLVMIDCYSPQIGVVSDEGLFADPNNLSELSIAVSKALENRNHGLFVLDSLDTLILKRGLTSSLELIRTLRAKARAARFDSIITLNRQGFPTAILAAVQESVDGVFEMKVQEEPTGLTRYFRVPKLRGGLHHTAWTKYDLDFRAPLPRTEANLR